MKILLSPAKSIHTEVNYPEITTSTAQFLAESEKLVQKLKKFSPGKLQKLYDVSKDIAEINYNRFQNWQSPTQANEQIFPAAFAFTGEVYRGLNISELNTESLDYLNEHTRILSGLYGILKPFDLMFPYRLEMGTKYEVTPKIKNLYQFWGDKLTDYLNQEEQEYVINLASTEYFKAINTKKLKAKVITPVFKEFKNGTYKMLMTYAKNARGEMTRYCAENNIENPEDLKNFNLSNYQFAHEFSNDSEFVFVR